MAWLQSRAFVGPKYERSDSDYFYDWSQIVSSAEIPAIALSSCSLDSTINSSSTSISIYVSGGATPPTSGGVWIAGNSDNQAWEYISYSGRTIDGGGHFTLTGCVREPAGRREHTGSHNTGATVKFFWQLDTMSGDFSIVNELNDDECVIDWACDATGWLFPQASMRDGHLFVYQTRRSIESPTDVFTNEIVGFIDTRQSEHDYRKTGKWATHIVSVSGMINRYRAAGMRKGDYNLARGAVVQGSESLVAWWKERESGDYIEAEPSFDPSQVVDGEPKTLWIGDRAVGSEVQYAGNSNPNDATVNLPGDFVMITEIHLKPEVGQGDGYRYLQLTIGGYNNPDFRNITLATENHSYFIILGNYIHPFDTKENIILCENEKLFRKENPSADPYQIIEFTAVGKPNFLKDREASGALGLYQATLSQAWQHYVAWGSEVKPYVDSAFTGSPTIESPTDDFVDPLPAQTPGETYRYNFTNQSTPSDNWTISKLGTPGYFTSTAGAFLLLELPPLALVLAEDITSSYTGVVRISDGTLDTTAGLASSGSIQIGEAGEVVTYNNKTAGTINITARGQSSTDAIAHAKQDPIYVYESGLAINSLPYRTIEIARNGTIVPVDVRISTSKLSYTPRLPSDVGYGDDYDFTHTVTGNSAQTITYNLPSTRRIRYLLIEILSMSVDPARPRVNEIRALPDESYFETSTWFNSGETSAEFAKQILLNVGVPDGAINIESTAQGGWNTTENKLAWDVLSSYAFYANLLIRVSFDSQINISQRSYETGFYTPAQTWTRGNTLNVKLLTAPPESVAQVSLAWQLPDGSDKGTVYYPASADGTGEIYDVPEQIYTSESNAQARAEQIYWRKKFPYSWIVEAIPMDAVYIPGLIHDLTDWRLNTEMQPISRSCRVKSVDHQIVQSQETHTLTWKQVLQLVEILREQP